MSYSQDETLNVVKRAISSNVSIFTAFMIALLSAYPFLRDGEAKPHSFFDLNVYYGAVSRWLEIGDLYNWAIPPNEIYGFTYPPFAAVVFAPFVSLISVETAGTSLVFISIASIVLISYMSFSCMGVSKRISIALSLWIAPLLLKFHPVVFNMQMGQINFLLALMILIDVIYLKNTRLHGILMALAASIKLTPAIFGLLLVAKRDWISLARFVATGILGILLSFAVDYKITIEYFTDKMFDSGRVGKTYSSLNFNLVGVLDKVFTESNNFVYVITVVLMIGIAYFSARRLVLRDQYFGAAMVIATLGLLVSPISWIHHWIWFIPMLIFLTIYGISISNSLCIFWSLTGLLLFSSSFAMWFFGETTRENGWILPLALAHSTQVLWAVVYVALPLVVATRHRPAHEEGSAPGISMVNQGI